MARRQEVAMSDHGWSVPYIHVQRSQYALAFKPGVLCVYQRKIKTLYNNIKAFIKAYYKAHTLHIVHGQKLQNYFTLYNIQK